MKKIAYEDVFGNLYDGHGKIIPHSKYMEYITPTNLSEEIEKSDDEDAESVGSDFEDMLAVAAPINPRDPAYEKALRHMMALKHHAEAEQKVLRQEAKHVKAPVAVDQKT